ncbi:MAG TPA: hypothetical protein VHK64_09990, partial [Nocardioidaceae bacterium]|nr:hypothetical protein [Nocardioidaceae bacterium]
MSEPNARPAQLHAVPPEDEIVWLDEEPPDDEMPSDDEQPPSPVRDGDGSLTDAVLAERISRELLEGAFCWASGLGWMRWDGKRWDRCDEVSVIEVVRQYVVEDVNRELPKVAQDWRARAALTSLLGRGRISAVTALARGIVEVRADAFDSHPDLLNTPTGIVDLRTGALMKHDASKLLTKITSVGYRPGARHPDWDAALN